MKTKILLFGCAMWLGIAFANAQVVVTPVAQTRTYVGQAIQYSTTGQIVSGSVEFDIDPEGRIGAKVTLNGVTTYYLGRLAQTPKEGGGRTGSGYIAAADADLQPLAGAPKIPLFIKRSVVYGGVLDAQGVGTVFRSLKTDVTTP